MQQESALLKKIGVERLVGVFVFAVAMAVYIRTLCPTVGYGDTGELAAVSYTLGISHPTGYPLFTLLGFLWSHLPIPGTVIYKLNLLAALYTAGSALFLYKSALQIARIKDAISPVPTAVACGAGALAYAFARTIWDQAVVYEVYSLQLLLISALLFFCIKAVTQPETAPRSFGFAAIALGLSLTNHLTSLGAAPALLFVFFYQQRFTPRAWKNFSKVVGLTLLPLLLYLYLPMRSSSSFLFGGMGTPAIDTGATGHGWDLFFNHLSGGGYVGQKFAVSNISTQLGPLQEVLGYQLPFFIGWFAAAFGVYYLWTARKGLLGFLLLFAGGTLLLSLCYSIGDIAAYFSLAFMVLLLLATCGLAALARSNKWLAPAGVLLPALGIAANYGAVDQSSNYLILDFTTNLADNLPPKSVLFTSRWHEFTSCFLYLKNVENRYAGIDVLIPVDMNSFPAYVKGLRLHHPELVGNSEAALTALEATPITNAPARSSAVFAVLESIVKTSGGQRPFLIGSDLLGAEELKGRIGYQTVPVGLAYLMAPGLGDPGVAVKYNFDRMLATPINPEEKNLVSLIQLVGTQLSMNAQIDRDIQRGALAEEEYNLSLRFLDKLSELKKQLGS